MDAHRLIGSYNTRTQTQDSSLLQTIFAGVLDLKPDRMLFNGDRNSVLCSSVVYLETSFKALAKFLEDMVYNIRL